MFFCKVTAVVHFHTARRMNNKGNIFAFETIERYGNLVAESRRVDFNPLRYTHCRCIDGTGRPLFLVKIANFNRTQCPRIDNKFVDSALEWCIEIDIAISDYHIFGFENIACTVGFATHDFSVDIHYDLSICRVAYACEEMPFVIEIVRGCYIEIGFGYIIIDSECKVIVLVLNTYPFACSPDRCICRMAAFVEQIPVYIVGSGRFEP